MKLRGIPDTGMERIARRQDAQVSDRGQEITEQDKPEQRSYTSLVPGDKVEHYKFGPGVVVKTNTTMYSTPIAIVFCENYGEEIARPADEFKVVHGEVE